MHYLPSVVATAATLLYAPALAAGQLPVAAVTFAPLAQEKMQRYGDEDRAFLQSEILAAVSRAAARAAVAPGLTVTITVRDIAPTHPTRQQERDDPAIDVPHTRYLGGADLVGEVRDADQHVLTTVRYRHFPQTLRLGSQSADPWGDARLALEGFAARLTAACSRLHPGPAATPQAVSQSPSG